MFQFIRKHGQTSLGFILLFVLFGVALVFASIGRGDIVGYLAVFMIVGLLYVVFGTTEKADDEQTARQKRLP